MNSIHATQTQTERFAALERVNEPRPNRTRTYAGILGLQAAGGNRAVERRLAPGGERPRPFPGSSRGKSSGWRLPLPVEMPPG